jgi:sigma-B regulation protein RsbU (phosphoserine phosphatase)
LIEVAILLMFALLFAVLFAVGALAWEYHKGSIEHARREQELELARSIQRSFLPTSFPDGQSVEVHAVNVPSRAVSGDFYDVVPAGDALLLAIADVEGKSIPAALLTAMLQASLRTQGESGSSLAGIVGSMNRLVCRRADGLQQFATFFLARIAEGCLEYTNAGHNPPLLFHAAGGVSHLDRGGLLLGVQDEAAYDQGSVYLAPGDRVVLYTDGVSERARPDGEEFGPYRLTALVASLGHDLSAAELTRAILAAVETFAQGADPEDDQTLVVVRIRS